MKIFTNLTEDGSYEQAVKKGKHLPTDAVNLRLV